MEESNFRKYYGYFLTAAISASISFYAGAAVNTILRGPESAVIYDFNKDGKEDILVHGPGTKKTLLINTGGYNEYKSLDKIEADKKLEINRKKAELAQKDPLYLKIIKEYEDLKSRF